MTVRGAVLSLKTSGGSLNGSLTLFTREDEDMSTSPSPTESSMTSDQLTVVLGFFSFLVFLLFVVMLLAINYRKDPQKCCKMGSCQGPRVDLDSPPQYYSSRQTLVGSTYLEQNQTNDDNSSSQLFLVGLPSSYSLPPLDAPLPRLPSYESVRKKDRQRQIHMMIADRFGLNGPVVSEPPPTYEESVRQSVELPYDILPPGPDPRPPGPDPRPPGPDPRPPGPDPRPPGPDLRPPGPDLRPPGPDPRPPGPDLRPPGPDLRPPGPDLGPPGPDPRPPGPDPRPPGPDPRPPQSFYINAGLDTSDQDVCRAPV